MESELRDALIRFIQNRRHGMVVIPPVAETFHDAINGEETATSILQDLRNPETRFFAAAKAPSFSQDASKTEIVEAIYDALADTESSDTGTQQLLLEAVGAFGDVSVQHPKLLKTVASVMQQGDRAVRRTAARTLSLLSWYSLVPDDIRQDLLNALHSVVTDTEAEESAACWALSAVVEGRQSPRCQEILRAAVAACPPDSRVYQEAKSLLPLSSRIMDRLKEWFFPSNWDWRVTAYANGGSSIEQGEILDFEEIEPFDVEYIHADVSGSLTARVLADPSEYQDCVLRFFTAKGAAGFVLLGIRYHRYVAGTIDLPRNDRILRLEVVVPESLKDDDLEGVLTAAHGSRSQDPRELWEAWLRWLGQLPGSMEERVERIWRNFHPNDTSL